MLFGMRPSSLCSPTHQIIGGFLKYPLLLPLPVLVTMSKLRYVAMGWCWFFQHFFVRCKFHRAGFDDSWVVILLFDVQSSLIQTSYGMQGQALLWCARAAAAKSGESRGHRSFTKRSGTVATLTHFGFCPSTTVRMRSAVSKGPPLALLLLKTHTWTFPEKLNRIQIISQTHRVIGGMCGTFNVFLREPTMQLIRWKLPDNNRIYKQNFGEIYFTPMINNFVQDLSSADLQES